MSTADYFLDIPGIEGESKDSEHQKHIELASWSWGVQNTGAGSYGGGSGSGKATASDFHCTKKHDTSSPALMQACAAGDHFDTATLYARKAGGGQKEYLKWTLTDVMISSYQTGGSGGGDSIPMDSVSINVGGIKMEAREQTAKGDTSGPKVKGWSFKENKKV